MTELELLVDFHKDHYRQGPGSDDITKTIFKIIPDLNKRNFNVADIGCGTGAQTLCLSECTKGQIHAVDFSTQFLETLDTRAGKVGAANQIKTIEASMDDLPFEKNQFDLIWSEGAIYNMGFEKGLQYWKQFLKPNGYIAVSEISWITKDRPTEIDDFWKSNYPEIGTVSEKIAVIEKSGYSSIAHYVLPPDSWLKNYYSKIESSFDSFLQKHSNSESAQTLVSMEKEQISLYKKYKEFYSYGFYLIKKTA